MAEIMRNAIPIEVGGTLRRIIGATEVKERVKRVKFKHERTRFGNEHEFLRFDFDEAISFVSVLLGWFLRRHWREFEI